jgi:hypothetical protein
MKKLLAISLMTLIFCTSCTHDLSMSISHSAGITKADPNAVTHKPAILHTEVTLPMAKKT